MSVAAPPAFLGGTYHEAFDLLVEARDYLALEEAEERLALKPATRLLACGETLRLTARLTRIMAWLLAQRAVQAGEMDLQEALDEPLFGLGVCLDGEDAEEDELPERLVDLLGRSRRLYVRVARLDALARRLA